MIEGAVAARAQFNSVFQRLEYREAKTNRLLGWLTMEDLYWLALLEIKPTVVYCTTWGK